MYAPGKTIVSWCENCGCLMIDIKPDDGEPVTCYEVPGRINQDVMCEPPCIVPSTMTLHDLVQMKLKEYKALK